MNPLTFLRSELFPSRGTIGLDADATAKHGIHRPCRNIITRFNLDIQNQLGHDLPVPSTRTPLSEVSQ